MEVFIEYFTYVSLVFTSFFTLTNPFGSMPVFLNMSEGLTTKERNRVARKAAIIAFITLLLFAFTGQIIFKFFGISIESLRVVGGVIFFIVGYDMLQARMGKTRTSKEEQRVSAYVNDISITPLAIPMICGPGAITNAIVQMNAATSTIKIMLLILAIALNMLVVYWVYYGGAKILNRLGDVGNKVMMRIMGLIVMVIAVDFFFGGLKPILVDIIRTALQQQ